MLRSRISLVSSILAALAWALACVSCTRAEEHVGARASTSSQPVSMGMPLFSCGFVSYDGGATDYGQVLDDRGELWFYDLEKMWSPRPAGGGLYFGAGLRERFANAEPQSRSVSPEHLTAMRNKAEAARSGSVKKEQVAYDAGWLGCEAYIWERSDAYREVELGASGDFEIRNSSPEAEQLMKWLREDLKMGTHPKHQF
jgi:hypothetical protein